MRKLGTFIINSAILAAAYFGIVQHFKPALNIFYFVTAFTAFIYTFCGAVDKLEKELIESYLRKPNGHLPGWADFIFYVSLIFALPAFGYWWCAVAWLLIACTDGNARIKAGRITTNQPFTNQNKEL